MVEGVGLSLKFEAGKRNSNPNYFTQKERKEPLIVWSTENFGLEKKNIYLICLSHRKLNHLF